MTDQAIRASYLQPAYKTLPAEARYLLALCWMDARIHHDGHARMTELLFATAFDDSLSFSYALHCLIAGEWLEMPVDWCLAFYRIRAPGHQKPIDPEKERQAAIDLQAIFFDLTKEGA